jgi:anti-sigma regulatory factor (Ser/Thr protein kinase)
MCSCPSSCLAFDGPDSAPTEPVRHVRRFDPEPAACPEARRFVRRLLAEAGTDAEVAELLTSELAANVIRYGRTPFTVVVSVSPVVRVAVHDGNAVLPARQAAQGDDEAGRGLLLIESLADAWGVEECGDGKAVWFELF